jgi:hypothetical protein
MGSASGPTSSQRRRPPGLSAQLALWATLSGAVVGLLAVATAVAWAGEPGSAERSAPPITSPTTESAPSPTAPDPTRFEALGLPPPPPPPPAPTVHELEPGVSAPVVASSPTAVSPSTTIAALDQRVEFTVQAPAQPTTTTTTTGSVTPTTRPGSVLGGTVSRGTASPGSERPRGPLARTGARLVLPLAALGAVLLSVGAVLRAVGRRRQTTR